MPDYDFDAAVKTKTVKIGGKNYTISEPSVDLVLKYTKRARELEKLDSVKDSEAILEAMVDILKEATKIPVTELRKKPVSVLMKISEVVYGGWEDSKNPSAPKSK